MFHQLIQDRLPRFFSPQVQAQTKTKTLTHIQHLSSAFPQHVRTNQVKDRTIIITIVGGLINGGRKAEMFQSRKRVLEEVISAIIEGNDGAAGRQISTIQAVNGIAQLQNLIGAT